MLGADGDLKKLWLHARLAKVHDLRKEYVQAAGHAAEAMMLSEDVHWKSIAPVCDPNAPEFAAVKEAYENLQAARSKVKNAELSATIARMLKIVQPLYELQSKEYHGPAI